MPWLKKSMLRNPRSCKANSLVVASPGVVARSASSALLRRVATPLALSLMLWVPIAWTFALVGPKPVEAEVDVLHPGFEGDEVGTTDEASTSKTDDDESIGD